MLAREFRGYFTEAVAEHQRRLLPIGQFVKLDRRLLRQVIILPLPDRQDARSRQSARAFVTLGIG
jgi:hypothetical protein